MLEQERLTQVKEAFEARGLSIAEWARANGFDAPMVYAVLAGRVQARRGKAHRIAMALGVKQAPIHADWLDRVFTASKPAVPRSSQLEEATM
ncbi:DNA-binding protein [Roseateles sp.]|uniref:DNA-binding protein n=1 Tax=Roseateles sp. TaxID=1971397 RepID=UPI0039EAD082